MRRDCILLKIGSPDGKIHYIGRSGKKTYKRIEGRARIWKQGVPKEVKHFFGFELKRWRLNDQTVAFQIRPTLVFAEPNGQLILDARVGSLRRRLNPLKVFDEPKLEFANRQLLEHPRDGLTLFGPIDSSGIDKPKCIRFGLIGSSQGIGLFNAFAARFRREIPTIEAKEEI